MKHIVLLPLALLAGCGFLPPAGTRMIDACQRDAAGQFRPFSDCIARQQVATAIQDGTGSTVRNATAMARGALDRGEIGDTQAFAIVLEASIRAGGSYEAAQASRARAFGATVASPSYQYQQPASNAPISCTSVGRFTQCQ